MRRRSQLRKMRPTRMRDALKQTVGEVEDEFVATFQYHNILVDYRWDNGFFVHFEGEKEEGRPLRIVPRFNPSGS